MDIEPEKRERIINAAMEEFAKKGYKNASTNEIVKKANISKGLLFHYFGNKKDLFLFLYDYAWEVILKDFYSKINLKETDIIKRLRQTILLRIELVKNHPDLDDFLMTTTVDDSIEIKKELDNKYKSVFQDSTKKLTEGVDTSGLKEGLDLRNVIEIMMWVAQGYNNREIERMRRDPVYKLNFDINVYMAGADRYIELLTNAFFK
jgi:AcrR family transcriptional regulator